MTAATAEQFEWLRNHPDRNRLCVLANALAKVRLGKSWCTCGYCGEWLDFEDIDRARELLDALNGIDDPQPRDHTGVVRDPLWPGDRAPCGCPRDHDLFLCCTADGFPWSPACPTWPREGP